MTGGYNGPLIACERCDATDFKPPPAPDGDGLSRAR